MNKLLLKLVCLLLWCVNIQKASELAHWDDAQNFMEWLSGKNPEQMQPFCHAFKVLEHRANERKTDLEDEQV